EPDRADEGEQRETYGNDMADRLVGDKHAEFPSDERVELARAVLAPAEVIGELLQAKRLRRGCEQVGENLESLSRQVAGGIVEDLPARHEEAAHGVGDLGPADHPAEPRRKAADFRASLAEIADAAAADVSRAENEIDGLVLQRLEHVRQKTLVVLKVPV